MYWCCLRGNRYCSAVRAGEVSSGLLDGESNVLKQATRMADSWRSLPEEQRKVVSVRYFR
jgi:hypothetical protein